jgi:hypothetical protein
MDAWREEGMLVRFNGGPLDGQSHEIADEPDVGAVITWPPNADLEKHEDAIPGSDDVVEYLYRGHGAADYVGGLLDPSVDPPAEG